MSLKVRNPTAENLLLSLRKRMRESRDTQVLAGAANKYMADHQGEPPKAIGDLVPNYLEEEPGALWAHYAIGSPSDKAQAESTEVPPSDQRCCCSADDRKQYCVRSDSQGSITVQEKDFVQEKEFRSGSIRVGSPDLSADQFLSSDYNIDWGGKLVRYIPPPITGNDFRYRLVTSDNHKVDKDALREGRFRLAAYVDDPNQRVVIATDKDTLTQVLESPATPLSSLYDIPELKRSKLRLQADPRFLVSQGQLYSDKSVNDLVDRYLLDFVQYSSLLAFLYPLDNQRGLIAEMILSYD